MEISTVKTEIAWTELVEAFHGLLKEDKSLLKYLVKDRGISTKTIKKFKIGKFPTNIADFGRRFNIDLKAMRENDLIWNVSESQFSHYPVVIPITDVWGEHLAIGCRTLLSEEERRILNIPKYKNSKYKKTHHLFALDKAIDGIREKNEVIVVEGYFDAISAHQYGMNNVVATCGTMFSQTQLMLLSRYTDNIQLMFDSDEAGKINSERVVNKFANIGFDTHVKITISRCPDGYKDLDEYLRSVEE